MDLGTGVLAQEATYALHLSSRSTTTDAKAAARRPSRLRKSNRYATPQLRLCFANAAHLRNAAAEFDSVRATRQIFGFAPGVVVLPKHDHDVLAATASHDQV